MTAPPVQFVTTSDKVSIAFTVQGEGQPFVFLPTFLNHVQNNWRLPTLASLLTALSQRFRLVHYDARGMGMSTRGLPKDLRLDHYIRDLDAVVNHLNLDRFVLYGHCNFGLLAVHYAALHPERVAALILDECGLSWTAGTPPALLDELPAQDWDMFLYNMVPRDRSPEDTIRAINYYKDSVRQSDYVISSDVWRKAGIETLASSIRNPTLVLAARDFPLRTTQAASELAQRLPNSRLVLLDGLQPFGRPEEVIPAIDAFLANLPVGRSNKTVLSGWPPCHLTHRESDVLRLIAAGGSTREIADHLVVSTRTIERHITHIYGKIGARGRADATAYALKNSLI